MASSCADDSAPKGLLRSQLCVIRDDSVLRPIGAASALLVACNRLVDAGGVFF